VSTASFHPGGNEPSGPDDEASLWSQLGLPEPPYLDERREPPINRALLLRLIRRELTSEQARAVYWLVVSFVSWRDAHAQLVAEEFRRRPAGPP
jgi:hypothetical protein